MCIVMNRTVFDDNVLAIGARSADINTVARIAPPNFTISDSNVDAAMDI